MMDSDSEVEQNIELEDVISEELYNIENYNYNLSLDLNIDYTDVELALEVEMNEEQAKQHYRKTCEDVTTRRIHLREKERDLKLRQYQMAIDELEEFQFALNLPSLPDIFDYIQKMVIEVTIHLEEQLQEEQNECGWYIWNLDFLIRVTNHYFYNRLH